MDQTLGYHHATYIFSEKDNCVYWRMPLAQYSRNEFKLVSTKVKVKEVLTCLNLLSQFEPPVSVVLYKYAEKVQLKVIAKLN